MNAVLTGLGDPLPDAARAYVEALPAGEVLAFALTPLDRVGLPVWALSFFSPVPAMAGVMPRGVGYGLSDEIALLGGLGEVAEAVWPALTLPGRARTRGSYTALAAHLGARAVADPLTLCLPAGSAVGRDTVLDWVEAQRAADGNTVLVPIDLVACGANELSPGYEPFTTLISNGMGAGPDLEWAIGHGLCEVLQRDGNGLLFRALDAGVKLDLPDDLPHTTQALLDRFAEAGIRVLPKFATDQFGIPNLYCVGRDIPGQASAVPIMVTACGEGCHPDRLQALEKALTEFAASRVRKAFSHGPAAQVNSVAPANYVARFMAQSHASAKSGDGRAFATMRDWTARSAGELRSWLEDSVLAVRSHRNFSDVESTPASSARERGRIARSRVEAAGFDVLFVDMSPPDRSIAVVKVIVPRMEVETMSYHRIGERNVAKLQALDSPLIRFGAPTEALRPVRLTPEACDRLGGQPLFDTALAAEQVGPLYPLYREPEAHHVAWMAGQPA